MFAPEVPEYDCQLEYRLPDSGIWGPWRDASSSNGYGRHSRVEYMEQSLTGSLAWQVRRNLYQSVSGDSFDRIVQSLDYGRALHFVRGLHAQVNGQMPGDSIQLRLSFRFTPPMDQAHTYQLSYLEFPAYDFTIHAPN